MKAKQILGFGITALLLGSLWGVFYLVQRIEEAAWVSYTYFYGLGLPIFITCCIYVVFTKAVRFQKGKGNSLTFYVMILAFSLFVMTHALWTYLALNSKGF